MIDLKKIPKGAGWAGFEGKNVYCLAFNKTGPDCRVKVVIIKQTDWNKIVKFVKEKSK